MPRPWTHLGSRQLGDFRIFTLRSDRKRSPRTQAEHEFYVIDCGPWVNVIALTADENLVMVEQYRHGSNTTELEIPGGMMDPGDGSPVEAGARELREETGYAGDAGRIIGEVFPNPAIQSNTCYTVLFENCVPGHELKWDPSEELVTRLVPVSEIPALVAGGKIKHSLVVVALYHFELRRRGLPGAR
jgi:8-oxo-dGTP pyrophosphatase MutT (NUDIX family)